MGISFSLSNIVYTTLRCDTSANLRADIDAAFTLAGITTKSTVSNGFKYTLISPQSLKCKVLVQDQGTSSFGSPAINVQFMSLDETLQGVSMQLVYSTGYNSIGYELIVNICQFFVALKGVADEDLVSGGHWTYSLAGGIPYVAALTAGTECAASGGINPGVNQIFWCCGTGGPTFQVNSDFRNSRSCSSNYSHCLNGSITNQAIDSGDTSPGNASNGTLQIYPLTATMNVERGFAVYPKTVKFTSLSPLYVDAFVGWGFSIQGQLWDALTATSDQTLDSTITVNLTDVHGKPVQGQLVAWNHYLHGSYSDLGTYFSTLYLLSAKPTGGSGPVGGGNVAY